MKVQVLRHLRALMKIHPIHYANFKTITSRFIQILHHSSVSKDNSSEFFLAKTLILWTKNNFQNDWRKIHQIPYVMFETTSQFFFKLWITPHCHER